MLINYVHVINIFFAIILEQRQQIWNNSFGSTLDSEEKEKENIELQINKSTSLIIDDNCVIEDLTEEFQRTESLDNYRW